MDEQQRNARIRELAREIWDAEGRPDGQATRHWAMAERLVDAEQRAVADADDEDRAIRELLREMVQEELNGELGQRFSANLRAVIRREIAAAIDAHLDRF